MKIDIHEFCKRMLEFMGCLETHIDKYTTFLIFINEAEFVVTLSTSKERHEPKFGYKMKNSMFLLQQVTRRLSLSQDAEVLLSASAAVVAKTESEGISEEFSDVVHAIGEMDARLARQRQPSATIFIVEALTLARDGGILDWDDRVCDVLDDREMVHFLWFL